jgi:hypothetical protein
VMSNYTPPRLNQLLIQLNNNGHPVDGALVGVGSLWPKLAKLVYGYWPCYITK